MLISSILKKYYWRIGFTLSLILAESILYLLFPLFIGNAIGDVIEQKTDGLWQLGILSFALVIMGGIRRMYDSRFYAKLYIQIGSKITNQNSTNNHSKKTARLTLLTEIVKFAENQIPDIIQHSIGLIGVMAIIAFLSIKIFIGTIIASILVVVIYLISGNKTYLYNQEYNNELEEQVDVIASKQQSNLKFHLHKLMKWNIKLSDIETVNFSIS